MSTPNFTTMDKFDLYVTSYKPDYTEARNYLALDFYECKPEDITDEQIEQYLQDESYFFYDDIYSEFEALINREDRELQFFDIRLESGYYEGVQFYVEEKDNPYEFNNEDCRYWFDMCRSESIRKYDSERNYINKKLLPRLAKYLGFVKLNCIGIFSNGEAIYELAK